MSAADTEGAAEAMTTGRQRAPSGACTRHRVPAAPGARATLNVMTKKTGPAPRFAVDDAVTAALNLGIDAFSMAQVAARLGVTPPALYRVVRSREELLRLSFAQVVAQLQLPSSDLPWQQRLRAFAERLWELAEAHPGMPQALMIHPQLHTQVWELLGRFADDLLAAGCPLPRETLLFALDFLGDTVVSTHMGLTGLRAATADGAGDAAAGSPFMNEPSSTDRGYLERKIDFIIAGLEAGWPHQS